MKVWTLIALASLLACGSVTKEEADAGTKTATPNRGPSAQDDLDGGDGWSGPCDRRITHTFELDGATWTVTEPTLCDPTPYIEKGDPPWQTKSNAL